MGKVREIVDTGYSAKKKGTGVYYTDRNGKRMFNTEKGIKGSLTYWGIPHENYEIFPVILMRAKE